MKLCKDCKHYKKVYDEEIGRYTHQCVRKAIETPPCLVSGAVSIQGTRECFDERYNKDGECGEAGQYWEPQDNDLSEAIKEGLRLGEPMYGCVKCGTVCQCKE